MVLAGGEGQRLYPLTLDRAKPAVPFAGRYRIIDFALSNLTNSGFLKIKVLTQYKADSLIQHLARAWNLQSPLGHYVDVVPAQMRTGRDWFRGSADAIYQNLNLIAAERPDVVAIFGADHIYRMDVRQMLEYHLDQKADITVASIPVDVSLSGQFGVIRTAPDGRVIHYEEKPERAEPGPGGRIIASMGNFMFNTGVLVEEVTADAGADSGHDIARDVVARVWERRNVYAYDFGQNSVPGMTENERAYWKDVGTLDAYYGAHLDLVSVTPVFSLYNELWPIRSFSYQLPPAKFVFSDFDGKRVGLATDSLVCEGAIVSGGTVVRSVLSPMVRVNSYSSVEDSILLNGVDIGRHSRIRKAIIDKHVRVPPGTVIGYDPEKDAKRFHVSEGGVVVVPRGYVFQ
jgi:glucose-1-phosphate adenylyltransferase